MAKNWLDQHLEEFVKPHLGFIPDVPEKVACGQPNTLMFGPNQVAHLKTFWDRIKQNAKGRPVILPGRDVYLYEILARLEDYPTDCHPEISGSVAYVWPTLKKTNFNHGYMIDTGYSGSVPKNLKQVDWGLMWISSMDKATKEKHQIIPEIVSFVCTSYPDPPLNYMAGLLECAPKYWKRGKVTYKTPDNYDPKNATGIVQELSEVGKDEFDVAIDKSANKNYTFENCAKLVQLVAKTYMQLVGM